MSNEFCFNIDEESDIFDLKPINRNLQISLDPIELVELLIKKDKLYDARCIVVKLLGEKDRAKYACYAAKKVLKYYEDKHPNDKHPRKAINAVLRWIKNSTKKNKEAAWQAHVDSCVSVYHTTERTALEAARAALYASQGFYYNFAINAVSHANGADPSIGLKALKYGIKLLRGKNENR